jgi:hypothetical protein
MQIRAKAMFMLALMTNALMTPSYGVDSKPPATRPPGIGDPGDTPFKPKPRPTPTPTPVMTPEQIAATEAAFMRALTKYVQDYEKADANYSWARTEGDSVDWELASYKLYMDQLDAEVAFWSTANDWLQIANAGVWGAVAFKVGQDFAMTSPAIQIKAMGIVAMLTGASALAVTKIVGERTDHYKTLAAKQKIMYDNRLKIILDNLDYGGTPPGWDELFPGCQFETTCIPAKVCTPSGGRPNCEMQQVCDTRIVKC